MKCNFPPGRKSVQDSIRARDLKEEEANVLPSELSLTNSEFLIPPSNLNDHRV